MKMHSSYVYHLFDHLYQNPPFLYMTLLVYDKTFKKICFSKVYKTKINCKIKIFLYMDVSNYLLKMKELQQKFIDYIGRDDETSEEYLMNLQKLFNDMNIQGDKDYLRSVLYLVLYISNYHFRSKDFFSKFEKILKS